MLRIESLEGTAIAYHLKNIGCVAVNEDAAKDIFEGEIVPSFGTIKFVFRRVVSKDYDLAITMHPVKGDGILAQWLLKDIVSIDRVQTMISISAFGSESRTMLMHISVQSGLVETFMPKKK